MERWGNNYKEYPETAVARLLTVKRLKGPGFTLNEAGNLLVMIECPDRGAYVLPKITKGKRCK
jgi:hypothetical protein